MQGHLCKWEKAGGSAHDGVPRMTTIPVYRQQTLYQHTISH